MLIAESATIVKKINIKSHKEGTSICLKKTSFNKNKPIPIINKPIPILNIFSILPCPKGWSKSAGLLDNLTPTIEKISVTKSEIEWIPEKTTYIQLPKIPPNILIIIRKKLVIILTNNVFVSILTNITLSI